MKCWISRIILAGYEEEEDLQTEIAVLVAFNIFLLLFSAHHSLILCPNVEHTTRQPVRANSTKRKKERDTMALQTGPTKIVFIG